jgi:hypothetical protein
MLLVFLYGSSSGSTVLAAGLLAAVTNARQCCILLPTLPPFHQHSIPTPPPHPGRSDLIHPAGQLTYRDLLNILPMLDETVVLHHAAPTCLPSQHPAFNHTAHPSPPPFCRSELIHPAGQLTYRDLLNILPMLDEAVAASVPLIIHRIKQLHPLTPTGQNRSDLINPAGQLTYRDLLINTAHLPPPLRIPPHPAAAGQTSYTLQGS